MSPLARLSCGEPWSRVSAGTEGQTNKDTTKSRGGVLDRGATVHLVFGWRMWRTLVKSECVHRGTNKQRYNKVRQRSYVEVSWIEEQQCIWCLVGGY